MARGLSGMQKNRKIDSLNKFLRLKLGVRLEANFACFTCPGS